MQTERIYTPYTPDTRGLKPATDTAPTLSNTGARASCRYRRCSFSPGRKPQRPVKARTMRRCLPGVAGTGIMCRTGVSGETGGKTAGVPRIHISPLRSQTLPYRADRGNERHTAPCTTPETILTLGESTSHAPPAAACGKNSGTIRIKCERRPFHNERRSITLNLIL